MTPLQLDQAYTHLCNTLTKIGSDQAELYLARFAMLAISREFSFERAKLIIDDAARDLEHQLAV